MRDAKPFQKIIWAVDPCAEGGGLQRSAAWAIKSLTQEHPAEIEPVYVWGSYLPLADKTLPAELVEEVNRSAQDDLEAITRRIRLSGLKRLKTIVEPFSDTKRDARELLAYAKRAKADLIVVSTHANRAPKRWFVGSFAETLMLTSDVPLLVVNPSFHRRSRFREIVFPTDFSAQSKEAFEKVVEKAASLGMRILVFHKVNYPFTPSVEVTLKSFPQVQKMFREDIELRKRLAAEWAELARGRGVQTSAHMDFALGGSTASSVIKFVRRTPALIAMASHSGAAPRAFQGKTTRMVIRHAEVPVWVIQPTAKAEEPLLGISEEEIMEDLTLHGGKKAA